ncbi:hypothetical protein ACFVUH_25165 [Kitasatospora sp. NPDC058032]|uniref:hypothetical protein n=1 Tax=Kitasatospora sp. NPDC058032 TaxID=3346307 RepID=UPI0036DE1E19
MTGYGFNLKIEKDLKELAGLSLAIFKTVSTDGAAAVSSAGPTLWVADPHFTNSSNTYRWETKYQGYFANQEFKDGLTVEHSDAKDADLGTMFDIQPLEGDPTKATLEKEKEKDPAGYIDFYNTTADKHLVGLSQAYTTSSGTSFSKLCAFSEGAGLHRRIKPLEKIVILFEDSATKVGTILTQASSDAFSVDAGPADSPIEITYTQAGKWTAKDAKGNPVGTTILPNQFWSSLIVKA